MPDTMLRRVALLVLPAAGVLAALHWSAGWWFGVTAAVFAAAHLLLMPNPSGRSVPALAAVAVATALVTHGSPVFVLGSAAVALPVGWAAVHIRQGRRVSDLVFPAEPAGLVVFGSIVGGASVALPDDAFRGIIGLLVLGAAVVAWYLTVVAVRAVYSRQARIVPRRLVLVQAVEDWPAYLALFSSGALYGITAPVMGLWALPLAGLPYAFSHVSLHRVQATRRTYRQTIQALGAVPEAGGMVAAGHAGRVAELAIGIGAEMGLSVSMLQRLEFAALLHDVGRVVLANPAIAAGSYSSSDVSGWSSAIMSEARYLENVAEVVAAQHHPYRRPGEERDPDLPLASKILRVTAAYDGGMNNGLSSLESIEALHRGAAYDYDPEVVACLRRVLERRAA
ncbi:MAG TPA: HD domain-containing phosphohydrolase [Acidimicrobiia bacterium]|nr:HD domain-containing phosphohydrolase [Acidimicrobiia bacterium]